MISRKMNSHVLLVAFIGLLTLSPSASATRRRSRIDAPVAALDDTLFDDNLAISSELINTFQEAPESFAAEGKQNTLQDKVLKPDIGESREGCTNSFEIQTGYMFSSTSHILDAFPGTLMLTECLNYCRKNTSCSALNYETGLCVLFSQNADKLQDSLIKSQFPVFTIYAQKTCLTSKVRCQRAWTVDRVQGYALKNFVKISSTEASRQDCYEKCLSETNFTCRSANWRQEIGICELSEMDRLVASNALKTDETAEYLENNCIEDPSKLCEFKRVAGRLLKTVDSVYQDIETIEECRQLCLSEDGYRCHSYDFGDAGENICRLSHHFQSSLTDIQDPYLEVEEAATFELTGCYNVSIDCTAGEMIAKIRTSKLFNGKVYAKGSPNSCSVDVKSSLEFELHMGFNDVDCNVRQNGQGKYINDVVLQHHDMIVTSSDLGLALTCNYDLSNRTVSDANLGIMGDIETTLNEEVVVSSPNVIMKITTRDDSAMKDSAEVGDPLAIKIEIIDKDSPYEIFVRELVAMDALDSGEIMLIDSRGCPTDHFIMGPMFKSPVAGKTLIAHFDAFKFPSSPTVQFRALVTPCMPSCEPVQCDDENFGGEIKSIVSYGKKRKRRDTTIRDEVLMQSIQIYDKFGFSSKQQQEKPARESSETVFYSPSDPQSGVCVNGFGLIFAAASFLLAQIAAIAIWRIGYKRRLKQLSYESSISNLNLQARRPLEVNSKHFGNSNFLSLR